MDVKYAATREENLPPFACDEDVAFAEAQLASAVGRDRLAPAVALAWHLRQRDTRRAVELADEALDWLAQGPRGGRMRRLLAARLRLVHAEARFLFAELDAAEHLGKSAARSFQELDEGQGQADAQWLLAHIALDRGRREEVASRLAAGAKIAAESRDGLRERLAMLAGAFYASFHTPTEAGTGETCAPDAPVALVAIACEAEGFRAFQANEYAPAVTAWMRTHEAALATGQVRRAINAARNTSVAFAELSDYGAALDWGERALDLARPRGWPASVGLCLLQTGDMLRALGRLDSAGAILGEALAILCAVPHSRNFAIALHSHCEVSLARGDFSQALEDFTRLERHPIALEDPDLNVDAWCGQANALCRLGRLDEARSKAEKALSLAQQQNDMPRQVHALRALASVHAGGKTPGVAPTDAALQCLERALRTARAIEGFTLPPELLDSVALECAATGDHARAYEMAAEASATRERIRNTEVTKRMVALQVRHDFERARAEAGNLRLLAEAEARRAEASLQVIRTLEYLDAVGQEITANLDMDAIFRALDRHVHHLLDATNLAVFILDARRGSLELAFGIENGEPLPPARVALDDPTADSARCVREGRTVAVDRAPEAEDPNLLPGTQPTCSRLFMPLSAGERILGVMSIQSPRRNAYGERERLVFRNLCAYAAIALDNAAAHRQIARKDRELARAQERQWIMRDIHDGIGGTLFTSLARVRDGQLGAEELARVLEACLSDLALTVDSLEPIDGDLAVLVAGLRYRVKAALDAAQIASDWHVTNLPRLGWVDPRHALSILRILQEALTNVVKHSHASRVAVWARAARQRGKPGVQVVIADDGRGFPASLPPTGRGLDNMRQRAATLGGSLRVASKAGATSIRLWIPAQAAAFSEDAPPR